MPISLSISRGLGLSLSLIVTSNLLLVSSQSNNPRFRLSACCEEDECKDWGVGLDSLRTFAIELKRSTQNCSSPLSQITGHFVSGGEKDTLEFHGLNEEVEGVKVRFQKDGSFQYTFNEFPISLNFTADTYCLQRIEGDFAHLAYSLSVCLSSTPFYRKCCPLGHSFDRSQSCVKANESASSPAFLPSNWSSAYPLVTFPQNCRNGSVKFVSSSLKSLELQDTIWKMRSTGPQFYVTSDREWKNVDAEAYCVDQLYLENPEVDQESCRGEQDILIVCKEETTKDPDLASRLKSRYAFTYVNISFLFVAMIVLSATALGFMVLEKQNIHKQSMLFYVLANLAFYGFTEIVYVDHVWPFLMKGSCIGVGILAHFFGISTFTWLSVINFDLWWTFRKLNPTKDRSFTRLLCYITITIVFPFFVIGLAIFTQFFLSTELTCRSHVPDRDPFGLALPPNPEYGKDHCFLANKAQIYYFYMPVGAMLIINVVFYLCTSYRLCSFYQNNQMVLQRHKSSCVLILKLFFVTGVGWICQVVHAFIENHERTWYWALVDAVSMLQSIAIFVIFICKKENLWHLSRKYPVLKGLRIVKGMQIVPEPLSSNGSTRLSRAEGSQRKSGQEFQQPSEIIQIPAVTSVIK